jgi:hypothetical protein
MVDPAEVRKQRWVRVVTSRRFLLPAIVGVVLGVFGNPPVNWLGWAAGVVAAGVVVWDLTWGGAKLTAAIHQDLRRKADRDHHQYLRELQRKLRTDRDPRTGEMLRHLRQLYDRMQDLLQQTTGGKPWQMEVHGQVRHLYQSCLTALERSFELWERGREMATESSRQEVMQWRTDLLQEVSQSIEHLGTTLDHIQTGSLRLDRADDDLARLRGELEQGLAVARNTEQRIEQLDREFRTRDSD